MVIEVLSPLLDGYLLALKHLVFIFMVPIVLLQDACTKMFISDAPRRVGTVGVVHPGVGRNLLSLTLLTITGPW